MVHEAARVNIRRKWPSHSVLHVSLLKVWVALRHLPDFFQSQAVVLNANTVFREVVVALKTLSKTAASALCENGLFCLDDDARFERVLVTSVFCDAGVSCDNTTD